MTETSSLYALTNGSVLVGEALKPSSQNTTVVVQDGRIKEVGSESIIPERCQVIDLAGQTLSPGFIDLQLNGCGGVLFNSSISEDTLDSMHATNLRFGCTSFLPTLITCSDEDMIQAISVVRQYQRRFPERVPGIHLEGPYLNPEKKGIHDARHIRKPSPEMIDHLCENADVISMVTLAPEMCPPSVISQLSEAGIVVSIGHTNATLEQVREAEAAGARFVTHLFNAMSELQNRAPGVVGATLTSSKLGAGIIADGYHIDWHNLLLSQKMMQDKLVLVTDATPAAGSDIESFEFAGQVVYHKDGKCVGKDGTLGGSALTMSEAVRNCIALGISVEHTLQMATRNPANVLGLGETMGTIEPGKIANLVVLDNDRRVAGTVSGGTLRLTQTN